MSNLTELTRIKEIKEIKDFMKSYDFKEIKEITTCPKGKDIRIIAFYGWDMENENEGGTLTVTDGLGNYEFDVC